MALNLYEMDPQIYDEYISTRIETTNFNRVFDSVKRICDEKGPVKMLDLCCGTGNLPRKWLVKLKHIKYTGVDLNPNFIRFAKEKLKDDRFNFVVHDAVSFKAGKKFDIVLATSSYHHIKDDKKRDFLKNISDHLKDGGVLIVYEKMVGSFSDKIQAVDSGTKFYLERIKYMMKTEKLSENQLFALFNEQYLTAIRHEEYKVDLLRFKRDVEASGMKIKEHFKLWPKEDLFHDDKIGDFIFLVVKS
ncbi:MAG: class I SAM-dependent methyltransferase [Nanoarchaeota archaeon]